MQRMLFRVICSGVRLAAITAIAFLQVGKAAPQPAPRLDLSKLPEQSVLIDDVVVPIPSEIFRSLDKIAKPSWRGALRPSLATTNPVGNQAQIALLLGVVMAEGFVAVEAEDQNEVKSIGRTVLSLAKAINVEKSILRRSTSIIEHAEGRKWNAVRKELDGVLADVREAMEELNSEDLSQLVSIGGWLRGTEALCKVVSEEYTHEGADLLRQKILLSYFDDRLTRMSEKLRSNKVVSQIQDALVEIRPYIQVDEDKDITAGDTAAIGGITSRVVGIISKP